MTLRLVTGDIFQSNARLLVNPVNCVGISGKGLAKQFAERFVDADKHYRRMCKLGRVDFFKPTTFWVMGYRGSIAFVPTKKHWRDPSSVLTIEPAVKHLVDLIVGGGFTSVAVPALGCGCGGIAWEKIRPLLAKHLDIKNTNVELYAPQ